MFACGNKNAVYHQSLVRERQFVTTNLLILIKIKNIKIVVAQQFNTSLDNKMINDIKRKELFELFLDYWNTIVHRQHFGNVENFVWTSLIFSSIKYYWIAKLNGNLEKLKYITSAMNYLDEDFDPNPFINNQNSYIEKLLDWEIEQ